MDTPTPDLVFLWFFVLYLIIFMGAAFLVLLLISPAFRREVKEALFTKGK